MQPPHFRFNWHSALVKGTAKRRLPKARCAQHDGAMRSDLPRSAEGVMNFWPTSAQRKPGCPQNRPVTAAGGSNYRPAVAIAGKAEIAGRVLAQEGEIGRLRPVRHC